MIDDYTVIYSKRKTLGLEITKDLKILVRAPLRASKRDIAQMVQKHMGWIESHLEKQRRRIEERPELSKDAQEALKKRAKEVIPAKVAFFGRLMGLEPAGVTITGAENGSAAAAGKTASAFPGG